MNGNRDLQEEGRDNNIPFPGGSLVLDDYVPEPRAPPVPNVPEIDDRHRLLEDLLAFGDGGDENREGMIVAADEEDNDPFVLRDLADAMAKMEIPDEDADGGENEEIPVLDFTVSMLVRDARGIH